MNDHELGTRVRTALAELYPERPSEIDLVSERRPVPSAARRTPLLLSVAAVVLIVAVATALVVTRQTGSHVATSGSASHLSNIDWTLSSVTTAGVTRNGDLGHPLVIRKDGSFQAEISSCESWLGTITFAPTTATVVDSRLSDHTCPGPTRPVGSSAATVAQDEATGQVVKKLLTGTLRWSRRGGQLIIVKTGIGSLTYREGPTDPPSPTANVPTSATTSTAALATHHWLLTSITDPHHAVASRPAGEALLIFDGSGVGDGHNNAAMVTLTDRRLIFGTAWTNNLMLDTSRQPPLSGAQAAYVYNLLTGTVSWAISHNTLTITKADIGTLTYSITSRS